MRTGVTVYATLGPPGTNHDVVLRRYLDRAGGSAAVRLYADFDAALAACADGAATHLMICAAHPDLARILSAAQYRHGIVATETFVALSQPMALLLREDVDVPRSVALHPATRDYTDLSAFGEIIEVSSTVAAFEGLQTGAWDSALTLARFRDTPGLRLAREINAPVDAWLILSRAAP